MRLRGARKAAPAVRAAALTGMSMPEIAEMPGPPVKTP
jgi:hypothetical protein